MNDEQNLSDEQNPYAAPKTVADAPLGVSDRAENVRRRYLNHEASVRSIGYLYYLFGGLTLVGSIAVLADPRGWEGIGLAQDAPAEVFGAVMIGMALLLIGVGAATRRLRRWARVPIVIFSLLGLSGYPLGTLINGYILYLVLSPKGRVVFSADHAEIMAATPHIRYRTSVVTVMAIVILVLFLAGMFGFAVFG